MEVPRSVRFVHHHEAYDHSLSLLTPCKIDRLLIVSCGTPWGQTSSDSQEQTVDFMGASTGL